MTTTVRNGSSSEVIEAIGSAYGLGDQLFISHADEPCGEPPVASIGTTDVALAAAMSLSRSVCVCACVRGACAVRA